MFWFSVAFIFSQIFVGISLILSVLSFQFKKRKTILLLLLLSAICIILQYILLERYVAATIVVVWFMRYLASYYYPKMFLVPIFICSFAILTFIFWKDIYDILPFLSASINTIWAFQKNDKYLRIIMLFWAPLLVIYYFLIGSPIWMALEGMFFVSNIIWYWRYYIHWKENK